VLPGAPNRQVTLTWRKAGADLAGREPPGRLRRLTGASVDHLRSSDRISDFDAALMVEGAGRIDGALELGHLAGA
jgi:hypothetical protein